MSSESTSSDTLESLAQRWREAPSPQLALHLAEKYRSAGRLAEAVVTLEESVAQQPEHVAAQVALGRYLLEAGAVERGREALAEVVRRDATHLVANKLLVTAYLESGEKEKARDRLDLYSLLNEGDPEIEVLERRLAGEVEPASEIREPPQDEASTDGPSAELPMELPTEAPKALPVESALESGASFSEGVTPDLPAALEELPAEAIAEPTVESMAAAAEQPATDEAAVAAPAAERSEDRELFHLIAAREAPVALADLGPPRRFDRAASPPRQEPPSRAGLRGGRGRDPFVGLAAGMVATDIWAALESEGIFGSGGSPAEPGAPDAAAMPAANATLAQLYLDQGHLDEADRIFRQLLIREPESRAAHSGLGEVRDRRRAPLAAATLLAAVGSTPGAERRRPQALVLEGYRNRLRRQAERS